MKSLAALLFVVVLLPSFAPLSAQSAADRAADALEGIDETLARQEARESREQLLEEARRVDAAKRAAIARQRREAQGVQVIDLTSGALSPQNGRSQKGDDISLERQQAVFDRVNAQAAEERRRKQEDAERAEAARIAKLQAELLEAQLREAKARADKAEAEAKAAAAK